MAPEILRKDSRIADARSDSFSLGHILYELATGQHFWKRKGWSELSDLICYLYQAPPPTEAIELDGFHCDFLPGAGEMIARMVKIDPEQRFTSVEDILAELGIIPDLPPPPPGLGLTSPLLIVESGTNRLARALLSLRDGERRVIGRGDIAGGDVSISRRHAEFGREGDRYLVRDLSTNGTWLRGIHLEHDGGPMEVRHGDRIKMGDVFLRCAFLRN